MTCKPYQLITGLDEPDLLRLADEVSQPCWPEFMLHDALANKHWSGLYDVFPAFQFALRDKGEDRMVAVGNSIPLHWDGPFEDLPDEGWDWALSTAFDDHRNALSPNTQCALQIVVLPDLRGHGLSQLMIETMKTIGREHGLQALIAPIRPTAKHRYPLTTMERYVGWTRRDSQLPFDPWMSVHVKMGARYVKICPRAMHIEGTIAEWEQWTNMVFPESDDYIIPGAVEPVTMNIEKDRGTYIEPNVWMHHAL